MKKIIIALCAVLVIVGGLGAGYYFFGDVLVQTISTDMPNSMYVGEKIEPQINISPSFINKDNIEIISSDSSILEINDGNVCAVAAGTAQITIKGKHSNKTADIEVTVYDFQFYVPDEISVLIDGDENMGAEIVCDYDFGFGISYSCDNELVATVDSSGNIHGVSEGDCVVKCFVNETLFRECQVHVVSIQTLRKRLIEKIGDKITEEGGSVEIAKYTTSDDTEVTIKLKKNGDGLELVNSQVTEGMITTDVMVSIVYTIQVDINPENFGTAEFSGVMKCSMSDVNSGASYTLSTYSVPGAIDFSRYDATDAFSFGSISKEVNDDLNLTITKKDSVIKSEFIDYIKETLDKFEDYLETSELNIDVNSLYGI